MGNTTLGGVTLHNGTSTVITDNTVRKESVLAVMPLYMSDSDATDVFDFGGVVKTITLTGFYTDTSTANLKTWVGSIEALIQGHQDEEAAVPAPYTFIDDLRGTILVKIIDFSSTFQEGDPTRINWSIKLVHSSKNS